MKTRKDDTPESTEPMVSLAEYAAGGTMSPVLMAGAEAQFRADGLSRKATAEDWQARIRQFAESPA